MKNILEIFKWFERNMFKLIFILIGVIIIYGIVMFLMPIFQFVGFIGDGFNEVQNIFQFYIKNNIYIYIYMSNIFLILPTQLFHKKYLDKKYHYAIWEHPHYFKKYKYNQKKG